MKFLKNSKNHKNREILSHMYIKFSLKASCSLMFRKNTSSLMFKLQTSGERGKWPKNHENM